MNDNHKETSWDWRWKRGNGSKQKAKELTAQEELFNRQAKTERVFRPSSPSTQISGGRTSLNELRCQGF